MNIFLKQVASALLKKYGDSISGHCVVFPNNRSVLFFRKYMSELISKPIFMPSLHTISSLIAGRSKLSLAEPVQLVLELYDVYLKAGNRKESLDEFYYWGEMLINDFDDIDKYLVDPEQLFTNIADLKEIDQKFGGLDEEIISIIKQFWINFSASNMTPEKTEFISVWQTLSRVYNAFRDKLEARGLAYEGMIVREQAGQIKAAPEKWMQETDLFHFVGFNALNKGEREILRELKKSGRARFYWDYEQWYVNDNEHEAGHFIRQNLSEFPDDADHAESREARCSVNIYSAPSDVAQAKLIPSLIEDDVISDDPNETAVILADENLLLPVLNSLPETVRNINVTMGYPLFQTPVYSFVNQLLRLQKNRSGHGQDAAFYYNDVLNILQHQYIVFNYPRDAAAIIEETRQKNMLRIKLASLQMNELFRMIFTDVFNSISYIQDILSFISELLEKEEDNEEGGQAGLSLQQEYIYSLILPLNQLAGIMQESDTKPGIDLYSSLADRIMRKIVIPFSGEPLQGVQVMGILETRSLDFKNIIFLSANEGKIPKTPAGNSYIPYNLREAFGLPTIRHYDAIFAYYFYRLFQRAQNINFIYNSSAEGTRSGEMSRFLLQLKYGDRYKASFMDTRFNIVPPARVGEAIVRTSRINKAFESLFITGDKARYLSPSGINTWITCKMKFYYRYIAGLKEAEEIMEEVDHMAFGNILHHMMKELYEPWEGKLLTREEMNRMAGEKDHIKFIAGKAFRKIFMKDKPGEIKGKNLVVTSIIERMAEQILKSDMTFAPLEIISLEKHYTGLVVCNINDTAREVKIGGTLDRADRTGAVNRVLDYKSGGDTLEIKSMEDLFDYDAKNRNSAAFQTLLYCELFMQNTGKDKVKPSLYPVRKIFSEKFSDTFIIKNGEGQGPVESYDSIRDLFMGGLNKVLSDIFDPGRDIEMTGDKQNCRYCPYNILCNRKN
ncbi:MAG: PD-(D/E)XK nuclease family protein [Bacteroidales bacterium]|nr:PD-(D/E)XK nuclease family protein [Bacteroidales bacterium]